MAKHPQDRYQQLARLIPLPRPADDFDVAATGVAMAALAVDLLAPVFVHRVIAGQEDGAVGQQVFDNPAGQELGQSPTRPASPREEASVTGSIVQHFQRPTLGKEGLPPCNAACAVVGVAKGTPVAKPYTHLYVLSTPTPRKVVPDPVLRIGTAYAQSFLSVCHICHITTSPRGNPEHGRDALPKDCGQVARTCRQGKAP
jgi:hypothetical protein